MPTVLQISVIVFCLALALLVIHLVAKERMLLKYSLTWLFLALALLACALAPGIIFKLATLLGFATASNFIFFAGLFCLLVIALSLSVIASRQALCIKSLTQRIALLEYEVRRDRDLDERAGADAGEGSQH